MSFTGLVNFFYDRPWAAILALQTYAIIALYRRLMTSQKEHLEDIRVIAPLADKLTEMLKYFTNARKRREEPKP